MDDLTGILPAPLNLYVDAIRAAAAAQQLSILVLAGVVWRESRGGAALRPAGPAGTGDFGPRRWRKDRDAVLAVPGTIIVPCMSATLGPGWALMPDDGGGWGRGLGQIDWMFQAARLAARLGTPPIDGPAWKDPTWNLDQTAAILREGYDAFPDDEAAAIDAYNAGVYAERREMAQHLPPDAVTTGGNYSADVLAHVRAWSGALGVCL